MGKKRKHKHGYIFSVYLELDLVKAIQDEAWRQRKSASELVEEILLDYLEKKKQKPVVEGGANGSA
jgi:metal-responsive CopG/Arc/MetJ family transcriptional regulator